ncbi:MAG: PP0621 family protein [Sulfurimonas sp.]|jgi:hypothetical protein|nr:PP0621 family protein [Sulfurimonadaceae bacterium]
MLGKIVVIALVIWAIYMLLRKPTLKQEKQQNKKQDKIGSDMVECFKCGVFFDESEAIKKGGKNYCSDECAK